MSKVILTLEKFKFSYKRDGWALEVKSLQLQSGTIYSLLGSNMAGKSTILRRLGSLELIERKTGAGHPGAFTFPTNGQSSGETSLLAHDDRMFPELSLWDNVRIVGHRTDRKIVREAHQRFNSFLDDLRLGEKVSGNTQLADLSSGGQALIRLARPYAWKARLVLIDEVTSHLDQRNSRIFFSKVEELLRYDCSIVLVSHLPSDHAEASRVASNAGARYVEIPIKQEGLNSWIDPIS